MREFVCLTEYAQPIRNGVEEDSKCRRRIRALEKRIDSKVNVIILTEQACPCRDHIADVREHYDLATVDVTRIYLRKNLVENGEKIDFTALCRLFENEKTFAVYHMEDRNPRTNSFDTSPDQYMALCDEWSRLYGEVEPFFQNMIMKDMVPLLGSENPKIRDQVQNILQRIDDDIICGTKEVEPDVLLKLLSLKYGEEVENHLVYRSGRLKYHNLPVCPLKDIPFLVTKIQREKKNFRVQGEVILPLEHSLVDYSCVDHKNERYELRCIEGKKHYFLGEVLHTRKQFEVFIPVSGKSIGIRFMYFYQNRYRARVRMEFSDIFRIVPDSKDNSFVQDGYLWKSEKRILQITPIGKKAKIKLFFTFSWKSIKMLLKR